MSRTFIYLANRKITHTIISFFHNDQSAILKLGLVDFKYICHMRFKIIRQDIFGAELDHAGLMGMSGGK